MWKLRAPRRIFFSLCRVDGGPARWSSRVRSSLPNSGASWWASLADAVSTADIGGRVGKVLGKSPQVVGAARVTGGEVAWSRVVGGPAGVLHDGVFSPPRRAGSGGG